MTRTPLAIAILASAFCAAACSSPPPPPAEGPTNDDGPAPPRRRAGPMVESELGALDSSKVQAIFDAAGPELKQCYMRGVGRIGFLGGDIKISVRVNEDGSTKHVFVKESTLGDRTTETCMLGVLKKQTWPKPQGGKEGTADTNYNFDPGDEERPPVEWSEGRMGDGYKKAKSA